MLFSILLMLLITSCNQQQKYNHEIVHNVHSAKIDTFFSDLFEWQEFNGNVLVAEGGKVIFEKSYGLANGQTR